MSEKYVLPLPEVEQSSEVSISQLSKDALVSMSRTLAGMSTAERLAKMYSLEDLGLSNEVREWAEEHLFKAASNWQKYNDVLESPMPADSHGLSQTFPKLGEWLTHMHQTVKSDLASGESARIILIPYGEMLQYADEFPEWLAQLRTKAGLAIDDIPKGVKKRLADDGSVLHFTGQGEGQSFKSYLAKKVEQGGEWGMILARETKEVDLSLPSLRSAKTGGVAKHEFDTKSYGLAEWVADSIQNDHRGSRKVILTGSRVVTEAANLVIESIFDPAQNKYQLELPPESSNIYSETDVIPTYGVT